MSSAQVPSSELALVPGTAPDRAGPGGPGSTADWRDQMVLYGSAAVALGAAMLICGIGTRSLGLGVQGAILTTVGTVVSWRLARWSAKLAAPIGVLGAVAGAAVWAGLVSAALEADKSLSTLVGWDAARAIGLRMAALLVAFSFLLLRPAMIGFALVPGLTVFGLLSGRTDDDTARACFVVYLTAGLIAVGWAMLFPERSEARHGPAQGARSQRYFAGVRPAGPAAVSLGLASVAAGRWRARHWLTLGAPIVATLLLGYALSLPVAAIGELYRWPVLLAMSPAGPDLSVMVEEPSDQVKIFPVGRRPPVPTDLPILTVFGEPAQYWRGSVFDQYTGSAWLRWQRPVPLAMTENTIDLAKQFPPPPGLSLLTHRVRAEVDMPFALHSPGQIQRAALPLRQPPINPLQVDPFGCVELPGRLLPRGATYETVSAPMGERPGRSQSSSLRAEAAGLPSPETLPKVYLAVPFAARRVSNLAQRVAGDQPTPERKLAALIQHLQRNYVYTLNAPPVPRGQDAADYFLFRQKRGHCDLFATSLALMARAVGIPTRVTTGFLSGQYDPKVGGYLLRDSDRHAWVEAYLPSSGGWITADGTSGGGEGGPAPRGLHLAWLRVRFFFQDHPGASWAMVFCVVAVLSLVYLRRRLLGRPGALAGNDPRTLVARAYAQFLYVLRRGYPRRPSYTPLEYLGVLESAAAPHLASLLPAARSLTEIFVVARYGPGPVSEEEVRSAESALAEVRRLLRRGGRRA